MGTLEASYLDPSEP